MPNFRYAVRSLGKSPLFTAVAIVSLALALAVNTTMFALVDAILHPSVPYHDGGRAFTVGFLGGGRNGPTNQDRFRAVQSGLHTADMVVPYYLVPASVQSGNIIEDQFVANIPHELFDIIGVAPAVGRRFTAADERPDAQPVALISYTLWIRLFHEKPLSQRMAISVGRGTFEVVGVMPRGMHFPASDVWLPQFRTVGDSGATRIGPFALIHSRSGVTREAVQNEMNVVSAGLNAALSPRVPLSPRLGSFARGAGWQSFGGSRFMYAAVVTVLLIACANLGTMLLARGMAHRREYAIRIALGASRTAIVNQVLAECGLIVAAGVGLGMLLTFWAVYVLPHYVVPYVPGIGDLQPVPSWRVFLFAAGIALATLALAGGFPALRAAATDPAEPIKEGAGSTGRLRDRYSPLIIIEVALSTALLMTAALFIIAVRRLAGFDFSYAAKQLQVANLDVRQRDVPGDSAVERFYDDITARAAMLPGVRGAATSRAERPDGPIVFAEEGKSGDHWMNLHDYSAVSPTYLSTLGIPIVRGRDFEAGDRASATGVVIVDDSAARRLWPDLASPVGRMIKLGERTSSRPWLRVIGVARSVELLPRKDIGLPPEPRIYVVYGHDRERERALIVRGDGVGGARAQAALGVEIRHEIERTAPWIRTRRVHRWLEGYENTRNSSTFLASLFTAFGGFGLVLCAVGLYGVLAYTVSRRVREFGTRIALGAQPRDVARLVLHDATVTVLAGIGIGAFMALAVTYRLADGLFDIRYELVVALIGAEVVLLGLATLASLGPLRQAIRANPVEILRAG